MKQQATRIEGIHLNDYKNIVIARWPVALAGFLVVFLGVAVFTYTTTPIYQAFSTLQVGTEKNALKGSPLDQSAMWASPIDTELQIILSRSIAEGAARRLHLDWQITKKSNGLVVKIAQFSTERENVPYRIELTGEDSFKVVDADNTELGSGKSGIPMKGKGISLLLADIHGKPGDSFVLSALPLSRLAGRILGKTKAIQVGQNTNILKVSYLDPDPKLAADVVNAIAQVYIDMSVAMRSEEASKSVEFIDQQLKSIQEDLDKAEKKVQAFKASSGVVSLDAESMKVFNKITDADKQLTQLDLEKKQLDFARKSLKESIDSGKNYIPSDPVGAPAAAKLADLEAQKKALLVAYTVDHPQVKAVQDQIDGIKRNLLSVYESTLKNLAKQGSNMTPFLAGYEGQLRKLPEKERELAALMRQTKVTSDLYTFLLQKHQELRVTKAATVSNINVIDPAVVPLTPIKPNKQKNLMIGLILGLLFGTGLAIFLEYLDDTIHDIEEAKRMLEIPLLAVIPHIAPAAGMTDKKATSHYPAMLIDSKSSISEAFRTLRTNIHFSALNKKRQLLMVTSSFPGEGKTTIVGNMAVAFSQVGMRVMLVDCDMRRPSLHTLFGHRQTPGLSELIAGDKELGALIQSTEIAGLDIISAGTIPPNPAEMLGSDEMRTIVETLRESYDLVILDAPPVLSVTDAPVLSTCADLVLLVIEAGRVPIKAARHMLELLNQVGAPIAGMILNDKKQRTTLHYKYYGESYQSYYGEDRKTGSGNYNSPLQQFRRKLSKILEWRWKGTK